MADTYAQFLEITGAEESLARTLLESCSYDLAAATEAYFAMMDAPSHSSSPPSSSIPRSSTYEPFSSQNDFSNDQEVPNYARMSTLLNDPHTRAPIESRIDRLIDHSPFSQRPLAPTLHSAFRSAASAAYSDRNSSENSSGVSKFSKLFSPPLDLLFIGTLDEGKSVALENQKWLLINVQDKDSFASYTLNRDVWQNDTIREVIKQSYTLMQMDLVIEDDTYSTRSRSFLQFSNVSGTKHNPQVTELLSRYKLNPVAGFPLILLIDPRTGELLWRHEGSIDAQEMLSFLCNHVAVESLDSQDPIVPRRTRSKDLPALRADEKPTLYRVPTIEERVSHVVIASYVAWYLGNSTTTASDDKFWESVHASSNTFAFDSPASEIDVTNVSDVETTSLLMSQSSISTPTSGQKRNRSEMVQDLTETEAQDVFVTSRNHNKKARSVGEELRHISWSGDLKSLEVSRGTNFIFRLLEESHHLTPEDVRLSGYGNVNPTPESLGTVTSVLDDSQVIPVVEEPLSIASTSYPATDKVDLVFDSDYEDEDFDIDLTDTSSSNQVIAISPELVPVTTSVSTDLGFSGVSSLSSQKNSRMSPQIATSKSTSMNANHAVEGSSPASNKNSNSDTLISQRAQSIHALVNGRALQPKPKAMSGFVASNNKQGQPLPTSGQVETTSSSMFSESILSSSVVSTSQKPGPGTPPLPSFDLVKVDAFLDSLRSLTERYVPSRISNPIGTSTFLFVFPGGSSFLLTLPNVFSVRILYAFVGYVTSLSHQFLPKIDNLTSPDVWKIFLNGNESNDNDAIDSQMPSVGNKRGRIDVSEGVEGVDFLDSGGNSVSNKRAKIHNAVSRFSLHLSGHSKVDLLDLANDNVSIARAHLMKEVIRVRPF